MVEAKKFPLQSASLLDFSCYTGELIRAFALGNMPPYITKYMRFHEMRLKTRFDDKKFNENFYALNMKLKLEDCSRLLGYQ